MTHEQCNSLRTVTKCVGVSFAAIKNPAGYRVFFGGKRKGFDGVGEAVRFLAPYCKAAWEPCGTCPITWAQRRSF